MVKSWPSGLDKGAELQFNLLEYTQPPVRGTRKDQQDTNKDAKKEEQASNSEDQVKEVSPEGSSSKEKDKSKEEGNATPSSDIGTGAGDTVHVQTAPPEPLVDFPKEYYESPDLKVIIKGKPSDYIFLVSSHALSIASRVWRRTLAPQNIKDLESQPFEDSDDGTIKVLYVDDIDPLALDILFKVIHWQTEDLPQTLPFDSLRKLAIACDRYDCGKVLNPWPLVWMEEYESKATLPGFEDWIFIAQVLDTRNTKAREISRNMVLEASSVSKCGKYLRRDVREIAIAAHTTEVELDFIPAGILEYVVRERRKAIDDIITMLRQFVGNMITTCADEDVGSFGPDLTQADFCQSEACSDIALGSLIRSLKSLGLWPLLRPGTPQEWHGSVTTLVMQIEVIKMTTFRRKIGTPNNLTVGSNDDANGDPGCQPPKRPGSPSKPLNPLSRSKRQPRRSSRGHPTVLKPAKPKTQSQRMMLGSYGKTRSIFDMDRRETNSGSKFIQEDSPAEDGSQHPSEAATSGELLHPQPASNEHETTAPDPFFEYPAFEGVKYRGRS
ncbi:hypothetical protein TWF281_007463 [Arthrobotrys megalospora]